MDKKLLTPDHLFEVSWEVCNKVGGIHTVISTKALSLATELKDNYILIGPDVWRGTKKDPDFTEDLNLYKSWKNRAIDEGLRVRVCRWNIAGNPIAILVDFTPFISQKDEIFKHFWEKFGLDSLAGQWDYIEPALFGYATGKVIESFTKYNLTIRDNIIAQFHEWMTGTGILYLKENVPQIGTVFTTHATVAGRCLAGNGKPLYENLYQYGPDSVAREFNIISKQSLEKISARLADGVTTVSEITAKEVSHFLERSPDIVTPNGFEDSFVPQEKEFEEKKGTAKQKIREVVENLLGYEITQEPLFIGTSGRYEFRNKGIDIFIDSLDALNKSYEFIKEIIAFILVPAHNYGPRKDLFNKLQSKDNTSLENRFFTHGLHDLDTDLIVKKIKNSTLSNNKEDKVKVIFVPCYLDGNDGIFNLKYYDFLIGLDLTVFPSYYEPWGYTPLESLAFYIPTITTSVSGFGNWLNKNIVDGGNAGIVVHRSDTNDSEVVDTIVKKIISYAKMTDDEKAEIKENAFHISRMALWKNFISYYKNAYNIALEKVASRQDLFISTRQTEIPQTAIKKLYSNKPIWKTIQIQQYLPRKFKKLEELSQNLWWSWNYEAEELFKSIDPILWEKVGHNPVALLKEIPFEKLSLLEENGEFFAQLNKIHEKFKNYLAKSAEKQRPLIAYFSMEYGFHDTVKIFSGGLGILAADYLKEASDLNVNMVGIGLLYRYGYFKQLLSINGEQIVQYEPQSFSTLPITPARDAEGKWKTITIGFPGRILYARIWRLDIGRTPLYLLDTDIDENLPQDRTITAQLYGGDNENRLKQEILLGIGGILALDELGIKPDLYHCNEGHAAFISLERLSHLTKKCKLIFEESLEIVRASTLFTTHTPVPAGHDAFSEELLRVYLSHYAQELNISWNELVNFGKVNPEDKAENFSMSHFAANMSQEINGVSWLHGEVTKNMFYKLWDGYYPEELHIGFVTNGVHYPTWTAKNWRELYETQLSENFLSDLSNKELWQKIYNVPDEKIWEIRSKQRKILVDYLKVRLKENWLDRAENPKKVIETVSKLNENILTIGFARRFATYKRANLLFEDPERLSLMVNNPKMPVQFLFAGKAHPKDKPGQDLIKRIVNVSKQPEFAGKIFFIENYDIELAKKLVQGVDVWLNTPIRPMEASGTSGEKAIMNGVLHFSSLDGWWVEGYREDAGWAIKQERTYQDQTFQDELDAETLYAILENQIIPLFYKRNENNIPNEWIKFIKNSIANICPEFTTKRMMNDYFERYYNKLYNRTLLIRENDYDLAKDIYRWKKKIYRGWESIEILSSSIPETTKTTIKWGQRYSAEISLDLNELSPEDIGIELVIANYISEKEIKIAHKYDFELKEVSDNKAIYELELLLSDPGIFNFGIRMFPKNKDLPHRQDFSLVKWI